MASFSLKNDTQAKPNDEKRGGVEAVLGSPGLKATLLLSHKSSITLPLSLNPSPTPSCLLSLSPRDQHVAKTGC